ncbi:MAG: 2-phosphosulfolactate phosphatase [Nitriliruptorales bacterium]
MSPFRGVPKFSLTGGATPPHRLSRARSAPSWPTGRGSTDPRFHRLGLPRFEAGIESSSHRPTVPRALRSPREAGATVVAGCLRNASAVAVWLNSSSGPIALIACGELWPDGSLRPCVEDLLGAGAIISCVAGTRSPEAELALTVFSQNRDRLGELVTSCMSGRELAAKGLAEDLAWATEIDASPHVALLDGKRFVAIKRR